MRYNHQGHINKQYLCIVKYLNILFTILINEIRIISENFNNNTRLK